MAVTVTLTGKVSNDGPHGANVVVGNLPDGTNPNVGRALLVIPSELITGGTFNPANPVTVTITQ